MRFPLSLAAAGVLTLLAAALAPWASAIETAAFGLDVVKPSPDGRLHITTRAGATSTGQLRLFNKTDAPLTIALTVSPATVDAGGQASLGGDATPVKWIELPSKVALEPRQSQLIEVKVRAPRKLPAKDAAVAVVAEPELAAAGDAPAVLERVAVTTLLEPDEGSLIASLGWYPWLALALLLAVAAWTAKRARSRRRSA